MRTSPTSGPTATTTSGQLINVMSFERAPQWFAASQAISVTVYAYVPTGTVTLYVPWMSVVWPNVPGERAIVAPSRGASEVASRTAPARKPAWAGRGITSTSNGSDTTTQIPSVTLKLTL